MLHAFQKPKELSVVWSTKSCIPSGVLELCCWVLSFLPFKMLYTTVLLMTFIYCLLFSAVLCLSSYIHFNSEVMLKKKAASHPLGWRSSHSICWALHKAAVDLKEMPWEGLPVVGVTLTPKSCSLKPFTRNGCVLAAGRVEQKLFWVPLWPVCMPVWQGMGNSWSSWMRREKTHPI